MRRLSKSIRATKRNSRRISRKRTRLSRKYSFKRPSMKNRSIRRKRSGRQRKYSRKKSLHGGADPKFLPKLNKKRNKISKTNKLRQGNNPFITVFDFDKNKDIDRTYLNNKTPFNVDYLIPKKYKRSRPKFGFI